MIVRRVPIASEPCPDNPLSRAWAFIRKKALDKILYEEVSRKSLLRETLRREKVPLIPLLCCTVG
jgi:hypothetical protein